MTVIIKIHVIRDFCDVLLFMYIVNIVML